MRRFVAALALALVPLSVAPATAAPGPSPLCHEYLTWMQLPHRMWDLETGHVYLSGVIDNAEHATAQLFGFARCLLGVAPAPPVPSERETRP